MLVALQWLWSYITFGKGARLITGVPCPSPLQDGKSEHHIAPADMTRN